MPTRHGANASKNAKTWAAAQLFPDDDLLSRVNTVNLERVLGDIQTDRGNWRVDGSPHMICLDEPPHGTSMPERTPSTTSKPAKPSVFNRVRSMGARNPWSNSKDHLTFEV
jgi:hypothetical protein